MNALLEQLGITLPIIQAPMAGVSTPRMAAAVSNAGGLGSLGVGSSNAAEARAMIASLRALSTRSFNVNLFCHDPARSNESVETAWLAKLAPQFEMVQAKPPKHLREIYTSFVEDDDMLAMLVREQPKVVSFHFGLPSTDRIASLHAAGIFLIATATSLREARLVANAGVDAIVAQGYEAGGHRGAFDLKLPDDELGTIALTRVLVRECSIPIIAAGGIMDGRAIAAALDLGASAAQLGTAFVACPESNADAAYRALLFSDAANHTVMTSVISGRPARCLENGLTRFGADLAMHKRRGEEAQIPEYPIAYDAAKTLNQAAKAAGQTQFGAQWAGQGAPLARELPAAELVAMLQKELEEARASREA